MLYEAMNRGISATRVRVYALDLAEPALIGEAEDDALPAYAFDHTVDAAGRVLAVGLWGLGVASVGLDPRHQIQGWFAAVDTTEGEIFAVGETDVQKFDADTFVRTGAYTIGAPERSVPWGGMAVTRDGRKAFLIDRSLEGAPTSPYRVLVVDTIDP
jgi:hypothetical protein